MFRLRFGAVLLTACVLSTGILVGQDKKADDKKPDEPKVKGFLPQNWGKLGLSADQKQDIYRIQAKYNAEIDSLKAKIDKLKEEEKAAMEKVLTDEQKKKLKEIKSGEKPTDKDKAIQAAKAALAAAEKALADNKDQDKKKDLEKALDAAKDALKKAEDAAKAVK